MRPLRASMLLAVLLLAVPAASGALPLFQAPVVDFVWSPVEPRSGERVAFESRSTDPDGVIVLHEWTIERPEGPQAVYGHFPSAVLGTRGHYPVTLRVVDATLMESRLTRVVTVVGSAPEPSIRVEPNVTSRGVPASLLGSARDIDGDAIVRWTWQIGEETALEGRNVTHTFRELGRVAVTLQVEDEEGRWGDVVRVLEVRNRPPLVSAHHAPTSPVVAQPVGFEATGVDPDVPNGEVSFRWTFSDGVVLEGATVQRTFASAGDRSVTLRGTDADGGVSEPVVLAFTVHAP